MPILDITTDVTGLVGVIPNVIYIETNDTVATVTTVGYLNNIVEQRGHIFSNQQMALVYTTDALCDWYQVTITGVNASLVLNVSPGDVLLPVHVGNIAVFTNVAGQIGDPVGTTAIHDGNIQAGLSGTAGALISFPPTAANGFLELLAVNAGGAFNTTISNAATTQSTVVSIPNSGAATANFIISALAAAGTQHITSGSLEVDAGNVIAGSSGAAGTLISFPTTAANGSFIIAAVANAGNHTSTLSSVTAIAQNTVYTLPDPANAVARVLVGATATPFTANHIMVASGTGGLVADAGYQMKTVAAAVVAGGAAAQIVVDAFVTAASNIVANWNTQTIPASILTVTPGVGQFTVTSTVDPGASTLNYIVTKV